MMHSDTLNQAIIDMHNKFANFPPNAHLFCPKIHEDDDTNYDEPDLPDENGTTAEQKQERIKDAESRHVITYHLSCLMGISPEDAGVWLGEWVEAVEKCLTTCDACVRKWHKSRERFMKAMEGDFPSENVRYMDEKLVGFDKQRIDRGLRKARQLLEEHGPMASAKLVEYDMSAVLALFEALCSMRYLSLPENRTDFDYVFENTQRRKPLRMRPGIIPTMTFFLFEEGHYRRLFAEAAWDRKPKDSLTAEEWDWAVQDQLSTAIVNTSMARNNNSMGRFTLAPEKICRFWRGFLIILRSLNEQRILESLRGMEVSPSVYFLALEHLVTTSDEALVAVLSGLRGLMDKSPKAFWAAYDQVTPSQLVEEVFKSPAFRSFLNKSLLSDLMVTEGNKQVPALAAWVKSLIRSLPLTRRSDVCESLLRHLFDTFRLDQSSTQEARATCTLAGLVALGESLDGYLQQDVPIDTGTALIMVNQLLNRVVQYREVIISAAQLKLGDRYNVGLSKAAMSITHSALALDAKTTRTEWNALIEDIPVQNTVNRDSGALWESFLEMLWSGRVELAKAMLLATMPLRSIEKFIPRRKEQLKKELQQFNARYQQQSTAIGKMLGRLSDFNPSDLDMFCAEPQSQTIHPIVASLIHGEEAIREAGFELVKSITGETLPSDAVEKMLEEYFSQFLDAFTGAVNNITSERDASFPWTHMLPILKCSEYVLNGLSDPSVGQLRSKTLTPAEHTVVQHWWDSQWRIIGHSFRMMRHWHLKVDKKVMEDFCRDVMELANKFFAQDGLMASALGQHSNIGDAQSNSGNSSEAMRTVLESPRAYSYSLVDMLQLRDKYLIQGIIEVIKKLVRRLRENDMVLPPKTLASLNNMLKKKKLGDGRLEYIQKTNMTDEQRIELLKALGEDAEIEEQFIGTRSGEKESREKERALKQSKLDFSKAGSTSVGSIKDHISEITPNFEKHKSLVESLKSKQPSLKPDPKPMINSASIREARLKEKQEKAKRDAEAIAKAKALRAPPKTVAGEGSGLQGIAGVRGKDHAPVVKDEIMVGSSSEDEDDSDEDELLNRKAKAGQKTDAERRRHLLLAEKRGPVKKTKLQRSAKDMRARLIPPMDVLHQAILEWDIFHEGNDPPNGFSCVEVSSTYSNPTSYKQTFFPLLINEAWRSFVTAKDEATSKPFGIKVLNRMTVDKFMEVTASVPLQTSRDRGLSEGDILLISKGADPLNQPNELHCLARIWRTNYKKDTVEVIYRLSARGSVLSVLLPGSEFHVIKITNMTTIEREYAALESLQYYDLMDEVLKAEPSPMLNFGDEAVQGVMKNYTLNPGQAKAILNAKENDGFTLVQGPPGTGKTKTIVAMVGCLMTGVIKPPTAAVAITRPGAAPSNGQGTMKKLLVCAPSNAAVDELVLRLKSGIKTMNGASHQINVVRLGRSEAINAAVKDVTLDELVKAKMGETSNVNNVSDREKLHQQAGELKIKLSELHPRLEAARAIEDRALTNKLQRELDELKRLRAHIGGQIEADKSSGNTAARENKIKRLQVQQEILDKAHVLCATLSASGHEMFKDLNVEFETVIIDEAAQCVELSALIPLKYGCSKCILVGDPKQLPPTVLSQSAARYGYDQSLFVRMQMNHSKDVHLLDQQYRMHPEISRFPSKEFYEGLLQDGADMAKMRLQKWHQSELLGPYRFFDVRGSQERGPRKQSLVNDEELRVAMQLYDRFRTDYSGIDLKGKIGIITPYKAQLFRLRQRFTDKYGQGITEEIEFNTTDAFQGRECEIIIFSCVRASPTGGIGFMTDIRRMNVGLTRAKSSLWILGDSRALVQGEYWAKLIEDAKQRDRYTTGNIMAMLSRPGKRLPPSALTPSAPSGNSYSQAPTTRPTLSWQAVDVDVEMPDADSFRTSSKYQPSPTGYGLQPRPQAPPTMPYRGPSIGGLNEKGEAVPVAPRGGGLPVIQTTAPGAGKKRPLEDGDDKEPNAKKMQQNADTALSRAPKGPREYQIPPQSRIPPQVLQNLGLPPRPPNPHSVPRDNASGGPGAAPKKKTADSMFIKRKPHSKR